MNILIVEDDQNKIKQLVELIKLRIPDSVIIERYSFQSGLKEILSTFKDIIILDMSMPTFDISPQEPGGRLRPFGGKEIIQNMYRKKIFYPVIVVTQFETFGDSNNQVTISQLDEELLKSYGNIYKGLVYYNAALNNWKDDLEKLMKKNFQEK